MWREVTATTAEGAGRPRGIRSRIIKVYRRLSSSPQLDPKVPVVEQETDPVIHLEIPDLLGASVGMESDRPRPGIEASNHDGSEIRTPLRPIGGDHPEMPAMGGISDARFQGGPDRLEEALEGRWLVLAIGTGRPGVHAQRVPDRSQAVGLPRTAKMPILETLNHPQPLQDTG